MTKEQLAIKLMEVYWYEDMTDNPTGVTQHALRLAEYVMEEQKRIVSPLLIMNATGFPKLTSNGQLNAIWEAGKEVLKNAGIENSL